MRATTLRGMITTAGNLIMILFFVISSMNIPICEDVGNGMKISKLIGKIKTNCSDAFNFSIFEFILHSLNRRRHEESHQYRNWVIYAYRRVINNINCLRECKRKIFLFHATFRSTFLISPHHFVVFLLILWNWCVV